MTVHGGFSIRSFVTAAPQLCFRNPPVLRRVLLNPGPARVDSQYKRNQAVSGFPTPFMTGDESCGQRLYHSINVLTLVSGWLTRDSAAPTQRMCDYTQVEYKCGHVRYIVKAWCERYQQTQQRCPPNVVAV